MLLVKVAPDFPTDLFRWAGRNYAAQVAIVKEMTGRNRAAQLEIVKQMSRQ